METQTGNKAFVIEWRQGFEIKIPQIDAEHKHLFELVKALDFETADRTVEELLEYVVNHFSHEQELMEQSRYPGFEQHLRLHEEFAAQVADFLSDGEGWSEERIQNLRRFLNKWLIGHIMTHDLRFGNWYAAQREAAVLAAAVKDRQEAQPQHEPASPERHRSIFERLFGFIHH